MFLDFNFFLLVFSTIDIVNFYYLNINLVFWLAVVMHS